MNNNNTNYDVRGLSGLNNIGNTCYMNAALQCLSASNLFVGFLIKKKFVSDIKKNIIDDLTNKEREKREKLKKRSKPNKKEYTVYEDAESNSNDGSNDGNESDVSIYLRDVKDKYYNSMTYNSYKLFKNMWKTNTVYTPKTFKTKLGKFCKTFRDYKQQDSQDFIFFLLNQIHDEIKCNVSLRYTNIPQDIINYIKERKTIYKLIKDEQDPEIIQNKLKEFNEFTERNNKFETIYKSLDYWDSYLKKNHSPVIDIFTGLYLNQIICTQCNKKSINFEPYLILPLPIIDRESNLQDCLHEFSKTEVLDNDNKYNCSVCKEHTVAHKNIYLWDLPEHLIIQLKRFSNNGVFSIKNNTTIKFPLENLTFTENYHEYRPRNYSYNLYGVIYHVGSLSSGHYYAYTKNPLNNKWYKFNDSTVQYIPDEIIEREIINGGSYILFYKKNYNNSENSNKSNNLMNDVAVDEADEELSSNADDDL